MKTVSWIVVVLTALLASGVRNVAGNDPTSTVIQPSEVSNFLTQFQLVKRYLTPLDPITLPQELGSKTDAEIMNYVNLLYTERKTLLRRLSFYMTLSIIETSLKYLFMANPIMYPLLGVIQNVSGRLKEVLDSDWNTHNEQLAAFMWEYMIVKKIDPKRLPKSVVRGRATIRVEIAPDRYTNFPVWRTDDKAQPLPEGAFLQTVGSQLKNWWWT